MAASSRRSTSRSSLGISSAAAAGLTSRAAYMALFQVMVASSYLEIAVRPSSLCFSRWYATLIMRRTNACNADSTSVAAFS